MVQAVRSFLSLIQGGVLLCLLIPVFSFSQEIKMRSLEGNEPGLEESDSFHVLHLMIAGNIYQNEKQINFCKDYKTGDYDFHYELRYVQPILNIGDVVIANLKTSLAGETNSQFSAPDEFGLALKYAGITTVVNANVNNAYVDKVGFKNCKELLNKLDIQQTGVFADNISRNGNYPLMINKKGFKLALLNYTNLGSRPAVSVDVIVNQIDKRVIERDLKAARLQNPDFIIVYFDWGSNLQDAPAQSQEDLAKFCLEQGAGIVVGTHPNTVQRIDIKDYYYKAQPMNGLVCYSLGNLISSNDEDRNKDGIVLDIELLKNRYTGETKMGDYGFVPVWSYYETSGENKKLMVLPTSALADNLILNDLPYLEKRRAINATFELRKMLGVSSDEIQYNLSEKVVNNVEETHLLTKASLNNRFNPFDIKNLHKNKEEYTEIPKTVAPNQPISYQQDDPAPKTKKGHRKNTEDNIEPGANPIQQFGNNIARGNSTSNQQEKELAASLLNTEENTTGGNRNNSSTSGSGNSNNTNSNQLNNDQLNSQNSGGKKTTGSSTGAKGNGSQQSGSNNSNSNTYQQGEDYTNAQITGGKKTVTNSGGVKGNSNQQSGSGYSTNNGSYQQNDDPTSARNQGNKKATENNYRTTGSSIHQDNPNYSQAKSTAHQAESDLTRTQKAGTKITEEQRTGSKSDSIALSHRIFTFETVTSDPKMKLERVPNMPVQTWDTIYRIQFYALVKNLPIDTDYYVHLSGHEVVYEDGYYKYLLGKSKSYKEIEDYWNRIIKPRYKQSFIVSYYHGRRIREYPRP